MIKTKSEKTKKTTKKKQNKNKQQTNKKKKKERKHLKNIYRISKKYIYNRIPRQCNCQREYRSKIKHQNSVQYSVNNCDNLIESQSYVREDVIYLSIYVKTKRTNIQIYRNIVSHTWMINVYLSFYYAL